MEFDELIKEGKTAEALRFLGEEYYNNGKMGYTRKTLLDNAAGLIERLRELVDMQQKGLLVELPCDPSKPVYRIAKCKDIPHQLDGTMYSSDGSPGTATGYYCPYEDNCPHDADDCDNYKNIPNVFEDSVEEVKISCWYDERLMLLENTGVVDFNDFGKTVFTTKEEAATTAIEATHET